MGRILARIALVAAICLPVMARAAPVVNLLTDGDFSQVAPFTINGGWENTTTNNAVIPGWTVSPVGNVDVVNNLYWQQVPGTTNSIDMNGWVPGSISQTFATTAGAKYAGSFYLSANPGADGQTTSLAVSAGSYNNTFTFVPTNTSTKMGWQLEGFSFTAGLGSTTTLMFTSLLPSGTAGPTIANVIVSAPEPSMGLMLGTGLVSFFGIRRRFAK